MRCIDADALIGSLHNYGFYDGNDRTMVYKVIQLQPTIEPERKKGKCVWCDSPFRIEYYWIDREGCTASFQDEEMHVVATGIARFCPNCGRDLTEDNDNA